MISLNRRSFVRKGLISFAGLPFLSQLNCISSGQELPKIGLQLYTIRDEIEKDIRSALSGIADMGFYGVEAAFWPEDISLTEAAKLLKEFDLQVFSAHVELPVNQQEKDNMLRMAEAYSCETMVWHGWPEDIRYKTREGISELIDIYNESNHFARSKGLQFGIHNHWWEYEKQESGKYPFEILLEELDENVIFEIDTYWARVAGHDPAEIIRRFGKRAPLIHIKDGPARYNENLDEDEPDPMVALGNGSMDIPAIATAARDSVEWMIVELDVVRSDIFKAVEESYQYLISHSFARGMK